MRPKQAFTGLRLGGYSMFKVYNPRQKVKIKGFFGGSLVLIFSKMFDDLKLAGLSSRLSKQEGIATAANNQWKNFIVSTFIILI